MDASMPSSPNDQDSPVTWHVIIWVLLSLAISSMAQPTGRLCNTSIPRRYRVYTSVSPIFCIADALSILLTSLFTWSIFTVSPSAAINLVNHFRLKRDSSEQSDQIERPNPASWPRWVVFIIGTAPALVKLVSFSGLQWSKTWGLMYGTSYLVIELVNVISTCMSRELPDSVPEALGYTLDEWASDANHLNRQTAEGFEDALTFINTGTCVLAVAGQAALTTWALYDIRRFYDDHGIWVTHDAYNAVQWSSALMFLGIAATVVVYMSIRILRYQTRSFPVVSWSSIQQPLIVMFQLANALQVFCPSREPDPLGEHKEPTSSFPESRAPLFVGTAWVGVCAGYLIHRFCLLLCSKVAPIGKALLVVRPVPIVGNTNGNNAEGVTTTEYQVDGVGVACLAFFCLHLVIGVSWYGLRYDPQGTMNPTWTDVFG